MVILNRVILYKELIYIYYAFKAIGVGVKWHLFTVNAVLYISKPMLINIGLSAL
jgi:hypothetical protein